MPESYSLVLSTAGTAQEADRLAEMLVSSKLAACVQIVNIASVYTWEGEMHKEPEYLLLIKTAAGRYAEVESAIVQHHSYEIPEIVQVPIERGLPAYLAWIAANTK